MVFPVTLAMEAGSAPLEVWQAAVLGLVEGITEYLPVSSTGHLILASSLMGLEKTEAIKAAVDDFNIVIQGGAILAVLGLYWPHVVRMVKGLLGNDGPGLMLFINLCVAFVPSAVVGLLLKDWINAHLFWATPVLASLLVGGLFMIVLDAWGKSKFSMPPFSKNQPTVFDLSIRQALVVGCMQVLAMWPGTSRSMMTIAGGMFVGLRPRQAAEFSFLLGLPTLGAATVYSLLKNMKHAQETGTGNLFQTLGVVPCVVGLAVAAVAAAVAVKWLVGFLNRHGLAVFGYYRIVLAIVLGGLIWTGKVTIAAPVKEKAGVVGGGSVEVLKHGAGTAEGKQP
jgi:undecaprenyl-diphosphatase